MKKLFPVSAFLMLSICLSAQFYIAGEPPASVKWQQINTGSFKVIFPQGTEPEAFRFADYLVFYSDSSKIVPGNEVRIPVIMRKSSVISNGYVSWAPKRIDVVMTAPQNTYPHDWLNQLALHEYRHVSQISALKTGFTKFLSFFSGEIATGITSSMVPRWFYEGDAVYNETKLSSSGRGRLPEFSMPLRTLLLTEKNTYSYDKAFFGSYKDFVPNHYIYGYQMVNYGLEKYGPHLWKDALIYSGRNPYLVTPLALYLIKNTGRAKQYFYKSAMDSLRNIYLSVDDQSSYISYKPVTDTAKNDYINYYQPEFNSEGAIISFKTGLDQNDQIISIDIHGNEEVLHLPGQSDMESLSSGGNYIVWDEITRDIRWGGRNYSEVMVFDITRKKAFPLIRRTRLFSPDISPDGRKIAAIEVDEKNRCFLSIIDIESRNLILKVSSPEGSHLQTPEWTAGNKIIVVALKDSTEQLLEFNPDNESWRLILESNDNIADPVGYGDFIIFRAAYGNVDNLFAVNKNSGKTWNITRSRYGAFSPAISRDSLNLVFNEYSEKGFDIVIMSLDSSKWIPAGYGYSEIIWTVENKTPHTELPELNTNYEAIPYSRMNLFNFHSWLPFYTNVTDNDFSELSLLPGVMLFSQNITGTAITGMSYYMKNGTHYLRPEISISGLYPVFNFSGDFAIGNSLKNGDINGFSGNRYNNFMIESYVPLTFSRGKNTIQVIPGISYKLTNISFNEDETIKSGLDIFNTELFFSAYKKRSYRDILPRTGFAAKMTYYFTPFNRSSFGSLFSYSGTIYLPGIMKHHNFYIRHGIQKQQPETYLLPVSPTNRPRGVNYYVSELHTGISLNYTFPVAYPDLSVPSVIYIKRIWLNGFFDYSYGRNIPEIRDDVYTFFTGSYYSSGAEINLDINPLRFIFPVSTGLRIGYASQNSGFFTEFLLKVQTGI